MLFVELSRPLRSLPWCGGRRTERHCHLFHRWLHLNRLEVPCSKRRTTNFELRKKYWAQTN